MGNKEGKITPPVNQLPENFTTIITGGYAGLGYEVSKVLTILGGRVILAGDNEMRAKAAMLRMQADQIELHIANADTADELNLDTNSTAESTLSTTPKELKVEFMYLNLRSLQSVLDFVEAFRAKGYPLNVLICNQAVVQVPQAYTENGYETHFQVNHLAHMLLTMQLTPELKKAGEQGPQDSRIIIVTSASHGNGNVDVKTVQGKGMYNKSKQYCNSRLYQVIAMQCIKKRLGEANVSIYAIRGGSVEREVKKKLDDPDNWGIIYNTSRSLGGVMSKLATSVNMCLNIALHPDMRELNGNYFSEGIPVACSTKAMRKDDQEVMWRYSLGCLKDFMTQEQMQEMQERYDLSDEEEEEDEAEK